MPIVSRRLQEVDVIEGSSWKRIMKISLVSFDDELWPISVEVYKHLNTPTNVFRHVRSL